MICTRASECRVIVIEIITTKTKYNKLTIIWTTLGRTVDHHVIHSVMVGDTLNVSVYERWWLVIHSMCLSMSGDGWWYTQCVCLWAVMFGVWCALDKLRQLHTHTHHVTTSSQQLITVCTVVQAVI